MSRIPPALLYLTIYNPTIQPALLDLDNEDAEEQAHILFYTAREHAVSRDRILRQVGLAKALVNFSEIFNAGLPCENVHSQARRMVMFSPEPDFWVHACYEVAKTARPPPSTTKGKDVKGKSTGKQKQKEPPARQTVLYDYHDGSVHDLALKKHFQCGYEEFKLLHGTFSSILKISGQTALELQLERFFTVCAWKWDIEDDDFSAHLGVPLHPSHTKLTPLVDNFASILPDELMVFALIPPHVIPPRTPRYPTALVRHVLACIPPPPTPVPRNKPSMVPSPPNPPALTDQGSVPDIKAIEPESGFSMPLSMPTMPTMPTMPAMNFTLDMKNVKWSWPNYLTFGKGGRPSKAASSLPSSPSSIPASLAAVADTSQDPSRSDSHDSLRPDAVRKDTLDVDTSSLLEAITTDSLGPYTRSASPALSALSKSSQLGESGPQSGVNTGGNVSPVGSPELLHPESQTPEIMHSPPQLATLQMPSHPPRNFLTWPVHLPTSEDALTTRKQRVLHISEGECTVAIVADIDHTLDLSQLAESAFKLIGSMQTVIVQESKAGDQQIPSAAKILQPKDRYIVARDHYTAPCSAGFPSRSEHLYYGQELLSSDLDILEVFSRGQNPQHWHIGKRGLGAAADGSQMDGEVFMEVARKETTLTDVDNELAGVVRRFVEQSQSGQ